MAELWIESRGETPTTMHLLYLSAVKIFTGKMGQSAEGEGENQPALTRPETKKVHVAKTKEKEANVAEACIQEGKHRGTRHSNTQYYLSRYWVLTKNQTLVIFKMVKKIRTVVHFIQTQSTVNPLLVWIIIPCSNYLFHTRTYNGYQLKPEGIK